MVAWDQESEHKQLNIFFDTGRTVEMVFQDQLADGIEMDQRQKNKLESY